MEERFWKIAGFWAIGLILFVATLIIIRWTIEFVTWSTIDSGWAQVIGSIAALGVAIFIMARQNANAARLITDADRQASLRRARSVHAIMNNCYNKMQLMRVYADTAPPPAYFDRWATHFTISVGVMTDIRNTLRAIPLHDLGSYELVDGLHQFTDMACVFSDRIDELNAAPAGAGLDAIIKSNDGTFRILENGLHRFEFGIRNLFD